MSSRSRVAVVTGAASGIGLAISKDLITKGWKVALADVNERAGAEVVASLPSDSAIFVRADVSSWDDQAALFKAAWDRWGRIDFHAANAGIDDRETMFGPTHVEGNKEIPRKPNIKTIEVDFLGVVYGTWLSIHYFRRNPGRGGRVVITSSAAGIYPMAQQPQYSASKHAVSSQNRALIWDSD
jgi:15-hydroxyprostaglandin dehydrogenase (NAD)